jgi:glycosyltransferase involved in cell wall biosynthesis
VNGIPPGAAAREPRVPLTAIVIAQNAAAHIGRCVSSLSFAAEVLVVDGGSADDTTAIAERHGARVVVNPWPGFAGQRRFALARAAHEWVLACDSDEVVTPELAREIADTIEAAGRPGARTPAGYRVRRRNQFLRAWMDVGPWSHDWQLRVMRRGAARVTDASVHEGYAVDGPVGALSSPLLHYAHPTLSESIQRLNRYTDLEAADRAGRRRVGALDALVLPAGVFFNYYALKGCWRAGVPGLLLAATTAMYRSILYVKLRLLQNPPPGSGGESRARA